MWRWRRVAGGVLAMAGGLTAGLAAGCAQELEGGLGGGLPVVPEGPEDARALLVDAVDRTVVARSVDATMNVGLGLGGADLDYDWSFDDVGVIEGHLVALGDTVDFEIRSDGTTAWVRTDDPDVREQLPPGVSWIGGPYDEVLDDGGLSESEGVQAWFLFFRGAEEIVDGGIGSVAGVDVRLVNGTIDPAAADERATADERRIMDEAYSTSSGEGAERFEFEVGLDRDRRIRSLDYTITARDDEGFGSTVQVHLEVRRFDQDVTAPEPPPADETVSIDELPDGFDALD
jgi:hypothetical protein